LVRQTNLKDKTLGLFKWVTMSDATEVSLWPMALAISNLRLIGTEVRGLMLDKKDVSNVSFQPSIVVSRLMKLTDASGMITFEWVPTGKKTLNE